MNKKAQVWVETVIYTLIGLGIMAAILTAITPKIKQMNDKATIEQTINLMNDLNKKINAVQVAQGNVREFNIRIKKGELIIDPSTESISYVMPETNLLFSEPGVPVKYSDINITTTESNKKTYEINLSLNYNPSIIQLTYDLNEDKKILSQSPIEYKILISNEGLKDDDSDPGTPEKININLKQA